MGAVFNFPAAPDREWIAHEALLRDKLFAGLPHSRAVCDACMPRLRALYHSLFGAVSYAGPVERPALLTAAQQEDVDRIIAAACTSVLHQERARVLFELALLVYEATYLRLYGVAGV